MTSRIALLALLLLTGCNVNENSTCGAGTTTTYDCTPSPIDSGLLGCEQGPAPFGGDKPDPDKVFPAGCRATIPGCSTAYTGKPEACLCKSAQSDSGLGWICPVE